MSIAQNDINPKIERTMQRKLANLRRTLKATFCFLLCAITPATYLLFNLTYENGLKQYFQYYVKPEDVDALNPPEKLIFLWTPIQGSYKEWSWGIGPDPVISGCGNKVVDGRCLITTYPGLLEKADVVLFSVQDIKQPTISMKSTLEVASDAFPQLPYNIRRKQLWLLVWYEPNALLSVDYGITDEYVASFDRIFNGTLSYRNDSFIPHNFYGNDCKYEKTYNNQIQQSDWERVKHSAISKPGLVSWLVSHCDTPSKREKYVDMMKKIIPVNVFGKCSDRMENETLRPNRDSKEEKEFLSKYKFYIAFENSRCPDYVTEKLYKILHMPVSENPPVPVVMGPRRKWYEENLPNNSFIHVDDFDSPEELASYLKYLDSHHESYLRYLNWRQNYFRVCEPKVRCKLCDFLLKKDSNEQSSDSTKVDNTYMINDFKEFWQKAKCFN